MKISLQRIYTKDNLELVGLLYEPESPTHTVLVHVHGMAGNFYENKFVDSLAKILTDNNIAFFAFNNRGCELIKDLYKVNNGKRDYVRVGDAFEKFEECVFDIEAAINFVADKGFTDIHLSGHSLGSPKVAYYLSETKDERIASVIFLSPADMVGLAKADTNYERDITTAQKMITEGKGQELMPFMVFGESYLSADTYISINHETSKVAIFNFYNPHDELLVLGKIIIPALTIMGRKDAALSIPIEEMMKRIETVMAGSPKVKTHILGDADHQYNDYQDQMAEVVRGWIEDLL